MPRATLRTGTQMPENPESPKTFVGSWLEEKAKDANVDQDVLKLLVTHSTKANAKEQDLVNALVKLVPTRESTDASS